jgi:hypothetical protein
MNNRNYKTSHGTELPLLNLRGKEYLEVKYRLVWFREEHPDWTIKTEFVSIQEKSALAKATILDEQGRIVSTSHKFENERGFPDFLEKAETGAIGRALALIGYGTQFCADELDEGARIVDAPALAPRVVSAESSVASVAPNALVNAEEISTPLQMPGQVAGLTRAEPLVDPGEYLVVFGRKYKGKRVKEIARRDIESYIQWLESESEKKKIGLTYEAQLLKTAVRLYYEKIDEEASAEETA